MKRTFVVVLVTVTVVAVLAVLLLSSGNSPSDGLPSTPPQSPSNLAAEPISQAQLNLHWVDNSDNEQGFKLYRDNVLIATLPTNATNFQDTNLKAGTSYQYSVTAYNDIGESSPCACSAKTLSLPPVTTKEIVITYSSYTTDQIGEWNKADQGYTYLVVSLDIENKGYDSFNTGHCFFSVVVNNVAYNVEYVGLGNILKVVDLLNGGKISGKLAFEVPKEVTSTGYQLKYQTWKEYNIEWIKQ